MPWMLYRYILSELLRVFALSATVLVMVVAFGAAIKPLAGDDLAGPLQTAKYIMLATVPMLQFALPFSAGFAATIVLHRMTSDNEILACSASGLSYKKILRPILVLGLVLLLTMVLLTQWVIPRFWEKMSQIIARDVSRLVQSSIDRGVPVEFGGMQIHADRLIVQRNPPDSNAAERLVLLKVAAAEMDEMGRIITDVTARQAIVDVHRIEGDTVLSVVLVDAMAYDGKTIGGTPTVELERPIIIRGAFKDEPLFMTQDKLLRMRRYPDRFVSVAEAKAKLADALRQVELRNHIRDAIKETGSVELTTQLDEVERRVVIFADAFAKGAFSTTDERPIEVEDYQDGDLLHRFRAAEATVRRGVGSTREQPTVDLVLESFQVIGLSGEAIVNDREQLPLPELTVASLIGDDPATRPYYEVLHLADTRMLANMPEALWLIAMVENLNNEISARLQKRYALSLTALLLVLLGATLAMWLRHSMPLVIYIWAFLPSIADILLISAGEQMIRDGDALLGSALMWSGNLVMLLVLTAVYWRLSRN